MRARAAAAARREALDHQRLADMRLGDDEIVDVEIVIVLGIGDRRFQALPDVLGDALARKLQIGERSRDLLAADQLRDEIELLRRDPQHAGDRLGLVFGQGRSRARLAHDRLLSLRRLQQPRSAARRRGRALGLAVGRMAVERAGRRELAELVADHFLGDRAPECASGRCRRRRSGRRIAAGSSSGGSRS